jgi:hypothetical protein
VKEVSHITFDIGGSRVEEFLEGMEKTADDTLPIVRQK